MTFQELSAIIRRRKRVLYYALAAAIFLSVVYWLLIGPSYTAQSEVLMVAQTTTGNTVASPSPIEPILSSDLPLLATTPTVMDRVARDLDITPDSKSIEKLVKQTKAKLATSVGLGAPQPGGVLLLTFKADSEKMAVKGANALATEITAFYKDNATERFTTLIADLQSQMNVRRAKARELDASIQKLISDTPYLDIKDGTSALNTEFIRLSSVRNDAASAAAADSAANVVTKRRTDEVAPSAHRDITESDPTFHNLRDQYARDFAHESTMLGQYSDAYPGLAELKHNLITERAAMISQEDKLRSIPLNASQIYASALDETNHSQSLASSDSAKVASIDQELASIRAKISSAKLASVRLATLQRDRDNATASYSVLATRLAEAVANKAEVGSVGSVIVLDDARYAKRSGNTLLSIALGFLTALLLSAILIFVLEIGDKRITDAETVASTYGVPLIGTIGR
jgi:uncharacterized protein involved in exopolysaccharide biosynthesis